MIGRRGFEKMDRNQDIQKVFEIGDDSLQGVLGYNFYVNALQKSTNLKKLMEYLPDNVIPHTFSWDRYYQKEDLSNTLKTIFEFYQSRISLIAMVNVFEVTLGNFIQYLNKNGHQQTFNDKKLKGNENYKAHIKWAYLETLNCDIGDEEAIKRLPITFGKIDNARRLRNLIVHNHGLFEERYQNNVIKFKNIVIELHPDYLIFQTKPQNLFPIKITTNNIVNFSKAHIEVLHVLHNNIQKKYFNVIEAYDYRKESKYIEWNKVLWGK